MKRFRSILVCVEDTPRGKSAVDQAVAVARESGGVITLTTAIEHPPRLFRVLYPAAMELHSLVVREWTERLRAIAAPLRDEGLDVSVRVLEGKPFLALTREVLRAGHDLLVKPVSDSTDGRFFGSTDLHLLRKCPCAIWITSGEACASAGVLALIDPDPEYEEINQRILQMSSSLAELQGTTVDVLHVWRADGESLLAKRVRSEELASFVEETRSCSAIELKQVLSMSGTADGLDRAAVG